MIRVASRGSAVPAPSIQVPYPCQAWGNIQLHMSTLPITHGTAPNPRQGELTF